MYDICRMHIMHCTEQLIQNKLYHLLSKWHLLRMNQSLQSIIHILHTEINLIEGVLSLLSNRNDILQTNDILMPQEFLINSTILNIFI